MENWIGEAVLKEAEALFIGFRCGAVQCRINIVNSFPGICRAWHKYCTKLNIVGLDAFLKLAVAIASIPYCMACSG